MFCGETHAESHRVAGQHVIDYLDFFGSIDARSPHRSKAYEYHKSGTKGMFEGVTSEMLDAQQLLLMSDAKGLIERIEWPLISMASTTSCWKSDKAELPLSSSRNPSLDSLVKSFPVFGIARTVPDSTGL
jgi:hypothetical protein